VSKTSPSPDRKYKKASGMKRLKGVAAEVLRHRDKCVVVDTDSDYIYIGRLLGVTGQFITLGEADVHDRRESSSKNEKYILESKKYGIRSNRKEVNIRLERIVSYSLLEDVTDY
jgi:CO dehydrogenase nickel-insertion accessory protein CooC1